MSLFSRLWKKFIKTNVSQEDQRRYCRLQSHHLLRFRLLDETKSRLTFVRNISAGGLCFYSKKDIPAGSMLELEISFPFYPEPIKAIGKVVREKHLGKMGGCNVAVEFVTIDEDARTFIAKRIISVCEEVEKTKKEPEDPEH